MKKVIGFIFLSVTLLFLYSNPAIAFLDFASTPNPVGSGARALGMGGAFIAMADDGTAASWNPAGLFQLRIPEITFVLSGVNRIEKLDFTEDPEADGDQSISLNEINFFSLAYPFGLFNRKALITINYQRLYDFSREWDLGLDKVTGIFQDSYKYKFSQKGSLSPIGIAISIGITNKLSFGFTLNIWDDDLTNNNWEKAIFEKRTRTAPIPGFPLVGKSVYNDKYSFKGYNVNFGMLWEITKNAKIGAVIKTPFTAEINHKRTVKITQTGLQPIKTSAIEDEEMDMPLSFGVGISYNFLNKIFLSADIYRTEWQDYVYRDFSGEETSPITGESPDESNIDPTHQIRMGCEYRFPNAELKQVISVRAGIFYDPAPAKGSPDDIYGFSLGSGFGKRKYAFDIAYQFRYGNNIGKSIVIGYDDFSEDMKEHMVYSSFTIRF